MYVFTGVLFLVVLYNVYSSTPVPTTGDQIRPKEYEYSPLFFAPRRRTPSSSSGLSDPQRGEGPETLLIRTTASKERMPPYKLKKNVRDIEVVSHITEKKKVTKNISEVNVVTPITENSFELINNFSGEDVSKISENDTKLSKDISDVDVVSKINEKTFESGRSISVDVGSYVSKDTFETIKDIKDFDVVSNVSTKAFKFPVQKAKNTSHVIARKINFKKHVRRFCDLPSDGGPISVNTSNITLDAVEKKYPEVKFKGRYSPPNCLARQRVAIIVPYRDRKQNLVTFLNHMHAFLIHQKLEYGIFIVEQKGTRDFNRGKLFNAGFLEAGKWQCYIFHDIDLLPLDQRNLYYCNARQPRLEQFQRNFGGVAAMTGEEFTKANGYSNAFATWSGEDNDLYHRLTASGYTVTQSNVSIAQYAEIEHQQKSLNLRRYPLFLQTTKTFHMDGLSTLQYRLVSTTHRHLYTHIVVDFDQSLNDLQELFQEDRNFKALLNSTSDTDLQLPAMMNDDFK